MLKRNKTKSGINTPQEEHSLLIDTLTVLIIIMVVYEIYSVRIFRPKHD